MKIDTTRPNLFPADLYHFLLDKHGEHEIDLLTDVKILSPSEFISICNPNAQYLIDVGFNGSIFLMPASTHLRVLKISHTVLAAFGLVELNPAMTKLQPVNLSHIKQEWGTLENTKVFHDLTAYSEKNINYPVGITPAITEVWGTSLWSLYRPQDLLCADSLTSDGLGLTRQYIPGFTLKEAIEGNKIGLVERSKMEWIWRELIMLQKTVEQMLTDLGFTVDLLNPANILITGKWPDWQLRLIDQELVEPTEEAVEYRKKMGLITGNSRLSGIDCYVRWPLIPEHIVISKVWNLSLEQSIQYMGMYYQMPTPSVLERLAQLPDLKNDINPQAQDYSNRNLARDILYNKTETLDNMFIKQIGS